MILNGSDPWEIPVSGFEVLAITFGGETCVTAYGHGGATVAFSFGGPFRMCDADDDEVELDAHGSWSALAPLLKLRYDTIEQASVDGGARLRLRFRSGRRLKAGPDPQYENWQVAGPGDLRLVAPPGGGDPRVPAPSQG
jgi:hypothetical protein